jgi:ubiquinone/menaquinone biosynthesis C-methylase UbiE
MKSDQSQKYAAAKHYFGSNAHAYEERRAQKAKWSEENRLVEGYVARLPWGASLLDVPFGTGRFAQAYLAAGLKVAGADISSDMIEKARQLHGSEISGFDLRTAPAEKLPFADRSFDYLICNRFIKWLPEEAILESVAKEFRRVCNREMLIQVKVGNTMTGYLASYLARPIARLFQNDDSRRATKRYSKQQLERCLVGNGWSLAEIIDAPKIGKGVKYLILRRE